MSRRIISYNKLWKLLIDRKRSKADLRREAGFTSSTLTRTRRDEEKAQYWLHHAAVNGDPGAVEKIEFDEYADKIFGDIT